MFESFHVPALSIQNPTTLSLYANGGITGTIVDSGDGVTTTQATWGGINVEFINKAQATNTTETYS